MDRIYKSKTGVEELFHLNKSCDFECIELHGFRMSLWCYHVHKGGLFDLFLLL